MNSPRTAFLTITLLSCCLAMNAQSSNYQKSIQEERKEQYYERKRLDSLKKAEAEKVWENAVITEGKEQEDGYVVINISNETNMLILIYLNDEKKTAVYPNSRLTGYKIRNSQARSIYAVTTDLKYKWGPIDLIGRKEDLYWKITPP
jgi:hypothetical protein